MNSKPFVVTLALSCGLMVLGAIAGGVLKFKLKLTIEQLDPSWVLAIKLFYLALFLVISFSVIPLVLHSFITLQGKIGNANLMLIRWLASHESQTVYVIWGVLAVGLAIALPAAIKSGFFK
jgi:hypothetical protein